MDKDLKLKLFIENLLNDKLSEVQIKTQMKAFGFKYSSDPKVRWRMLLGQLTESPLDGDNPLSEKSML